MNQIYKVIWSRVRRCYVVVSEIAGSCGKNGAVSEKKSLSFHAFLCALALTGCLMPGVAEASFKGGNGAVVDPNNSIAVGDDAQTAGQYTVALGSRTRATNSYAIAIGDQAKATGQGATAIGSLSKSSALHSLAVGDQAEAAAVNSSAYGILSKALSSHSVAIGNTASVGKGDPDSVSSQNGIAIGNGANVTVNPATATPGITDKSGGIAIGHDATTKDINTIALGTGTIGQGAQAVAIGRNAHTIANNGVAIGNEAQTQSTNGFALGNTASAGIDEAGNIIGKDNDQAFGSNARAWGGSSMAFGNDAKAANGGAIAMGNGSESRGDWGVAIGNGAKALAAGARALGANSTAKGVNSTAIGWDSEASGASSIAVGETVKSTGTNSVAIGTGAKAANENAIALGAGSETAAAVATLSATINGTAHNFAGTNPASTVSVGKAGSERTITNVAAGRISAASTDAINGSQLYAVTSEIDKGVAYAGDVKAAAAAANKFTRKLGEQTNIVGGVADTSKLTDGNIGVVSNGTDTLNIKLAKDVKVDSVTTGNTVINNNGLTVGGKTYVTNNGINANNQKVTNVADGQVAAGSKDAVNGGQLHDAKNEVINKGLRFDADNNSEKTNKLGSKVTVNGDNNITTEITQTGDDTKIGVKLNKDIHVKTVTATDTVKAGDVTMGGQTVANAAGANETGNYVTGLDNKTWNVTNPTAVSGRAATEDQLKTVTEAINNQSAAATDYRLVQNASSADGSYKVDTNGNIDLTVEDKNHAGQKETVKLKDIASKSNLDDVIAKGLQFDANAGGTKTNKLGSKITVKGEGTAADTEYSGENLKTFITQDPAGNTTIDVKMNKNLKVETIVATGKNGKDGKIGINGKDGVTTNISVTRDGKPGVDGAPGTTTTRIVYEKPDGTKEEVATLNDGMKYGGDTGAVIKKKLNEQVNVVGGITDENKLTTEDNLGVVSDGNNNLKVRMAKDLKGLNSVTTNTLTVGDVKIDNSGINAGNKKITNVAAGDISANSTDAVNGGQLWKTNQTINNIGGAVNELGDRMDRVGAGAAALAALHPLDFDPDDKWDVAAGYGNYKDAHAVSVGAFYRPNEDTMFSVGGSFGGGENMVNAGVSVKLGQGNHVSTSRVALAKEVEDLKAIVKAQSAEIKAMRGAMQSGASVMKDVNFPDVPKDHWAYSYVKSLADRGLLEGYPDGEFKGDRSMTRYEFAAIIYRALQNGAPIDSDMAKAIGEFDPEINRIKDLDRTRVDRISGKDNDRHKVERVRVNNESNKEKGDYRDVYGSHISPEA